MKKGICMGSLPGDMPVAEKLKLAKDAGFDGVEPGVLATDDALNEVKQAAAAAGVELCSMMNSMHWKCPFSSKDPAEAEQGLAGARRAIECAAELGAGAVLVVPGVVNEGVTYEEAYELSQKRIREVIPLAEEKGVLLLVENVWNKFLLSPIEFCTYVDGFGSPNVQAYFDVGNILLYGFPQHWIRSLGARIKRVHLKDFKVGPKQFVPLLEGDVNWPAVMEAFRDVGYDGYMTAEVGTDKSDPVGGVHKVSQAIDKIMAS